MILTARKVRGWGSNVTEVLLIGKNVRIKKYYENKENHSWIETGMKYNLISRLRNPKVYKESTTTIEKWCAALRPSTDPILNSHSLTLSFDWMCSVLRWYHMNILIWLKNVEKDHVCVLIFVCVYWRTLLWLSLMTAILHCNSSHWKRWGLNEMRKCNNKVMVLVGFG